jgi:hypothetical protein
MAAKRVAGKYSLAVAMCFESDSPARQNGVRGNHLKIKRLPTLAFFHWQWKKERKIR